MATDLGSGALQRQRAAESLVHQNMTAETSQHEDHTFSGIMFDIKTSKLPMEYIEVSSVWVRGDLGPITVWSTDKTFHGKHENGTEWTLHYKRTHNSNNEHFTEMQLDEPVRIMPGSSRGFYVHSALPGDEAIVYDNQRHHESHKNLYMTITPGWAHLSNEAFSDTMQNGFWAGRPWREFREFVGRISYGVRWLLWNPDVHTQLPPSVQVKVWSLLLSQTEKARSVGCLLGLCDKDTLLFILNKISWWEWGGVQQEFERMVTAFERKKRLRQEPEDSGGAFKTRQRCLWAHPLLFDDEDPSEEEEDDDEEEDSSGSEEDEEDEDDEEDEEETASSEDKD